MVHSKLEFPTEFDNNIFHPLYPFLAITTFKIMSAFSLISALGTIAAATKRVLPILLTTASPGVWHDTLLSLNPLVIIAWTTGLLTVVQILLSALTRTPNWNDRLWQIIPPLQALILYIHPLLSDPIQNPSHIPPPDARMTLMIALVLLWGLRLTIHAISRGVFSPSAVDYRYTWLKRNVISNDILFAVFYAVVGCAFFTVLLTLVVSPLYFAWLSRHTVPLKALDILATICTLSAIALETIADRQQQAFQTAKAASTSTTTTNPPSSHNSNETNATPSSSQSPPNVDTKAQNVNPYSRDVADGFMQSGLFAYCRHPNFCGEMAVWLSFHLFSISAGARPFNWTLLGPALYILLFQGSTSITEHISKSKYPRYTQYQRKVPQFIPLPLLRASSQVKGSNDTTSSYSHSKEE